MAFIHFFMASH